MMGEELERTLRDLEPYVPAMQSLSIVPVGLSRYREGLYPLEPFTREDAKALIRQVEPWRKKFYQNTGLHFVHLSDEFYILAEEGLPEEEAYDGYLQIENGVGMMPLFWDEAQEATPSDSGGKSGIWSGEPGDSGQRVWIYQKDYRTDSGPDAGR